MTLIPRPAVVVLVGASGSGKSTWARSRFASNEIVSSDALRAAVGTGEGDLDASVDAFSVLDTIVAARARRGLTTVIDTLGLDDKPDARRSRSPVRLDCPPSPCGSTPTRPHVDAATARGTGRCLRRR